MGLARPIGLAIALLAGACSAKSRAVGDAAHAGHGDAGSAAATDGPADAGSAVSPDGPPTRGDIQVRVDWKNVPVPARASPGLTACNTGRAPAVAPTTTWGIPEVLVFVEGVSSAGATARIALGQCALVPRVSPGSSLVVVSATERPTQVSLSSRGAVEAVLAGTLEKRVPVGVRLPIAGHAIAIELDPDAIYELATAEKEPETAWIAPSAAGVTDPTGVALISHVAPGSHAVVAWLPPRGGQKARVARGTVVVEAGDLAELTLQLE